MLKNYLKVAFRNLRRHPGYTFINIAGFSAGIACCLLIVLYVQDELHFDKYHERADDIYRVVEIRNDEGSQEAATAATMGPALVNDLPEFIDSGRLWTGWRLTVKQNVERIIVRNYYFTDPGFTRIFDFDVLGGDLEATLERPNGVILTETTARRLFGTADVVGQPIDLEAEDFSRLQRAASKWAPEFAIYRTTPTSISSFSCRWLRCAGSILWSNRSSAGLPASW